MRRREFITFLAFTAWSQPLDAQRTSTPILGFLSSRSAAESAYVLEAFRDGLRQTGFVEGKNMAVVYRWAEGRTHNLGIRAVPCPSLRVCVATADFGADRQLQLKARALSGH